MRKHINDIRSTFPETLQAISFNDEFGDVFGNIYAFTADGLSMRQLRDYVEGVRNAVLHVNDIGKTELIGTQDEAIYLDISARKTRRTEDRHRFAHQNLAGPERRRSVGHDPSRRRASVGPRRRPVRVGGELRAINLRVNDQFFRLSDVADIRRGYVDPPQPMFRFNGQPAIGLAIAMRKGGNILNFGEELKTKMRKVEADAADRRRRPSRLRSASRGRKGGRRFYRSAGRSDSDRAFGQLPQPRRAGRPCRLCLDPARSRRDFHCS